MKPILIKVEEDFLRLAEGFALPPEVFAGILCRATAAANYEEIILRRPLPKAAEPSPTKPSRARRKKGGA